MSVGALLTSSLEQDWKITNAERTAVKTAEVLIGSLFWLVIRN
jgi:hypothetical protein